MSTKPVGSIGWLDLTVAEATPVRDFYRDVVGWVSTDLDMGGYPDFVMSAPGVEEPVGGICHARGGNAGQPGGWMIYIVVADLDASLAKVAASGGRLRSAVRSAGGGRYAVIEDPSGACAALYQYEQG